MLDKSIIINCDKCTGDEKCPDCLGHQKYIVLGHYLIYWEKDYSDLSVFSDQTRRIVRVVINLILVLFVVLGLISFFYHAHLLKIAESDLLLLNNWQGEYLLGCH